jgi:hypothetical protein
MLATIDEPFRRELSWIALIAEASHFELVTHRVKPVMDYGGVTQVTFGGSGSRQFKSIFPQLCRNIAQINPHASVDDLREGFDATVLSALAGEEFVRPVPLQEGWGGGFEVIRLIDGRMTRTYLKIV